MASDVVCPFCGTLCDDIEVDVSGNKIKDVRHACRIGTAKFLSVLEGDRPLKPMIRKDGELVETSINNAIKKTAEILKKAKKPLLYGWSSTSCDAAAHGVAITEKIGGVIDSTSSVCHGPTVLAVHDVGQPSITLAEVKNRADLIIYWGSNPMHAHPRHLSRYTIYPRGYFRERGHQDRELIVVDVRKTDTAKIANKFVKVEYGKDYELLAALRAVVNGSDIEAEEVAGVKKEEIYKLAEKMKNCQFGVIFFGMGLTMTSAKHRNIDNAISLTKDLNRHTKFSIMPMRGHYNVTGFSEVLGWQSGFPFAVDYSLGYPRYNPGETTANDILQRGEADAAFIIASDPAAHFPKNSVEHLAKMPLIYIGPHHTLTTEIADVFIPSTFVGIEEEGTAYRMDTIPINMRKVVEPPEGVLSDEEICHRILKEIERGE
jgi:formylmethanofuran dehydrogenase subunit B